MTTTTERDDRSLEISLDQVATWCQQHPGGTVALVASTYAVGRDAFRRFVGEIPPSVTNPRGYAGGARVHRRNGAEGVRWPNGSGAYLRSAGPRATWRGDSFDRYALLVDLDAPFPDEESAPAFNASRWLDGASRPARVYAQPSARAFYGHEPCQHCPGSVTVVYLDGAMLDDQYTERIRAVVSEHHSGRCPFSPESAERAALAEGRPDAPQRATEVAGHAELPAARDGWAMTCSCGTSSNAPWAAHVEERIRSDQIRRTGVDVCANCGDLVVSDGDGDDLWAHYRGPGSRLWNCQHSVPYGARATPAHGGAYFGGPGAGSGA